MGKSWKSTDNYGKSWEHDMGWDDCGVKPRKK